MLTKSKPEYVETAYLHSVAGTGTKRRKGRNILSDIRKGTAAAQGRRSCAGRKMYGEHGTQ